MLAAPFLHFHLSRCTLSWKAAPDVEQKVARRACLRRAEASGLKVAGSLLGHIGDRDQEEDHPCAGIKKLTLYVHHGHNDNNDCSVCKGCSMMGEV